MTRQTPRTESERAARKRKVKVRLGWPTIPYSLRWDEIGGCTGEGGHGLFKAIRTWWQVRRGTWEDDFWLPDVGPDPEGCPCGGYWRGAVDGPYATCSACGKTREDPPYA